MSFIVECTALAVQAETARDAALQLAAAASGGRLTLPRVLRNRRAIELQ